MKKLLIAAVIIMASVAYSQAQDSIFVFHANPNAFIPREDSTGVIDTLEIPINVAIEDLNVFIGIDAHRLADALIIDIIPPWGDSVRLANRNPHREYFNCWFDTEEPEDGPGALEDYIGYNSTGQWIIQVAQWTGHYDFLFQSWAIEVVTRSTAVNNTAGDTLKFGMITTYPNPSNSSVQFDFSLSQSGPATLVLFDILGRRVGEVVNESLPAGRHSVVWSANEIASGVYYYALTSGGRKSQGHVAIVK